MGSRVVGVRGRGEGTVRRKDNTRAVDGGAGGDDQCTGPALEPAGADRMRVAVVGAGAVGGVIAAGAAAVGHDVTLRVRTPFEALVVVHEGDETTVRATISSEPVGPPADVVFLVVKATDTASTAPHLAALCGPRTRTVVVQNGVGHVERVAPLLPPGAGPVVPAITYVAAERLGPGRIHHIHGGRLIVPAEHEMLVAEAVGDGMRVRGTEDFPTEAWRKLFANLVGNPITAITLRHMDVMRSPGIRELARDVVREALAVARAEGAHLTEEDAEEVVDGASRFGPETGSSMLYDRLAGRPMEHQYLTGEVVRRGEAHDIAVPVNRALLALLVAIDVTPAPGTLPADPAR
jgi:2-dehydropantoate 2-reductase